MRKMITAAIAMLAMSLTVFSQQPIAYWDFNSGNTDIADNKWPSPINPTFSYSYDFKITHNLTKTTNTAGSTINALYGAAAGTSFSPNNGSGDTGKEFVVSINAGFFTHISLTFASTRSGTGHQTYEVYYSADGGSNYTFLKSLTINATWELQTVDLSQISEANNNDRLKVKFVLGTASGAGGTSRIDNLIVSGTPPLSDGNGTAFVHNNDSQSLLYRKDIWKNDESASVRVSIFGTAAGTLKSASVKVPQSWGTINVDNVSLGSEGFAGASYSVDNNVVTITNASLTDINYGDVVISNLTTPNTSDVGNDGSYWFRIKTAKDGGVLTEIRDSIPAFVTIPISNIRKETNGFPDLYYSTVAIYGVVTGIDGSFSTTGTDNFLQDATGGVNIFKSGLTNLNLDHNYYIKGQVIQFQGLTEVNPGSADDMIDAGEGTPITGTILTPSAAEANGSDYEGSVVIFQNASKLIGEWPTTAMTNNTVWALQFADDKADTFLVYIDSETDLDGTPEPTWPKDLRGIYTDKNGYGLLIRSLGDIRDAGTSTAVTPSQTVAGTFELLGNYPNPFNPSTTLRFTIPNTGHVTVEVVNVLGQKIATLVNGQLDKGYHNVPFNAASLASGVYFYTVQFNQTIKTAKFILSK